MERSKKENIIGWISVIITTFISSLWAYWGIIENFHEGWYSTSIWENLFMLFFQYLLFTIIFSSFGIISLKWRRIGLACFVGAAIFSIWFFSGSTLSVIGLMIVLPLIMIGIGFYYGNPKPLKYAKLCVVLIPILIIVIFGIPNAWRVSQRVNDGNFGTRIVEGNGVTLVWAPRGPGWPDEGISWYEALNRCIYLSEDGSILMETPQNIWRVPNLDELVRSQCLHGINAGGVWDNESKKAIYEMTPDKETPLWDLHSKVIYYWTSTDISENYAYFITYSGAVFDRNKSDSFDYLSFRAVKNV